MNEKLTELVFIIDESGSMSGLESDTVGGFNSLIEKQKREDGEAVVSTVMFSDQSRVVHDRVGLQTISPMTSDDYTPGGCTALLDAVGDAIHHIGNVHKYARDEDRPGKTLFIITTDGMENSSHRYSYSEIKKKIDRQKEKYGWEFLFLGANIDAVAVAGRMGIQRDNAVNYECDEAGTSLNYEVLERAVTRARALSVPDFLEGAAFVGGGWKDDIEKDFKKRHKHK